MKGYFPGWLIFFLLVGAGFFGCLVSFKKVRAVEQKATALTTDCSTFKGQVDLFRMRYDELWEQNVDAAKFLGDWNPHFRKGLSVTETLGELGRISTDAVPKGQQSALALAFDMKQANEVSDYQMVSGPAKVQSYTCEVTGSFYLVMNWLGLFEERFPMAKTDELQMVVRSNALVMTISFVVPDIPQVDLVKPLSFSKN